MMCWPCTRGSGRGTYMWSTITSAPLPRASIRRKSVVSLIIVCSYVRIYFIRESKYNTASYQNTSSTTQQHNNDEYCLPPSHPDGLTVTMTLARCMSSMYCRLTTVLMQYTDK